MKTISTTVREFLDTVPMTNYTSTVKLVRLIAIAIKQDDSSFDAPAFLAECGIKE